MSQVAPALTREPVDGTPRGFVGLSTRRLAWQATEGTCAWCGHAVPWIGPEVQYDHWIPLALGGPDDLGNIAPLHTQPCHRDKTRQDLRRIAKAKRQARLLPFAPRRVRRPIRSPGFVKHLTRGFDNLVRRKKASQKDRAA